MRASPSPLPIAQCERNVKYLGVGCGYGWFAHPRAEAKVAGATSARDWRVREVHPG